LIPFIQIQNAKSKHKKLCRQIAHLRGDDFRLSAHTALLIRKIREYLREISGLLSLDFSNFVKEISAVMAGLVPAIHAFLMSQRRGCQAQGRP
jgi:hypothetical protein